MRLAGSCEVDINGARFPGEGASGGRSAQCWPGPRCRPRRRGRPGPLLVACRQGFALLRRPRRHPGARRGRRRDRPGAPRGERQPGRGLRDQPPRREILERGRGQGGPVPRLRAARGDLRAEHDLAGLRAVAHRRRDFSPATRSSSPRLDHDGGVAPWLELAHDRDLVVRHDRHARPTRRSTTTTWSAKLGPRTRVVAFAWASNAIGTVVDAARVCRLAHEAGALAWIDAVHYAAHEPIDVRAIDADVLICSPYKFCGPHLGMAYGRAEVIESGARTRRARRPTNPLGRRFETGTAAVRAARRVQRDDRLPGLDRRLRRDHPLRARAGRAVPRRHLRRGHRLRATGDGGPRPDVPGQRRRRRRRRTWPRGWPSARSGSGRTTRGTR